MTYTPERLREMAAVMEAAAQGKKIECRRGVIGSNEPWDGIDNPSWNWHIFDYRVKREPMEIEIWVAPTGETSRYSFCGATLRKFREVIEP